MAEDNSLLFLRLFASFSVSFALFGTFAFTTTTKLFAKILIRSRGSHLYFNFSYFTLFFPLHLFARKCDVRLFLVMLFPIKLQFPFAVKPKIRGKFVVFIRSTCPHVCAVFIVVVEVLNQWPVFLHCAFRCYKNV